MQEPARRLVVGRLRKPHGLKGEVAVLPLTDHPEAVLEQGRQVWLLDLAGAVVAGPLEIARSRKFHREWLLGFRGRESRRAVEPFAGTLLAQPEEELAPPQEGEVYLHELEGFAVQSAEGRPLGLVTGWYQVPGGLMLEVQGPKREFLLPFRKQLVTAVERERRVLVVELPEGLTELG